MRFRLGLIGALVMGALAPLPAAGQTEEASTPVDPREEARLLADKGLELYEAGQHQEALVIFREAERHFSAPTIRLMVARTYEKLGRLIEARDIYKTVLDETLTYYAPKAFVDAQTEAKQDLQALIPRIPTIRVVVKNGPKSPFKRVLVTIDSLPVDISRPIQRNPGTYNLTASAPGRDDVMRVISMQEGVTEEVTLEFGPPRAVPSPQHGPLATKKSPRDEDSQQPSRGYVAPAIASFTVAGLAFGVGAFAGGLSLGKAGALEQECQDRRCYNGAGGETFDSAQTLATASTVSVIVGGVAAAGGIALLLWPRSSQGNQVGLVLGPGGTGVQGVF
jgi:hypothetical protein